MTSSSSSSSITRVPISDTTLPAAINMKPLSDPDLERASSALVGDLAEEPEKEVKVVAEELDDPFFVQWGGPDEMENPWNWGKGKRWALTMLTSMICYCATFASSLPSGATEEMKSYFGASGVVVTMSTSLFVLGYCFGPIAWAPLSEVHGRKKVLMLTFTGYMVFIIPCGLAKNIETLLVSRFIGGVFASSSLTNSGGTISDLWPAQHRGTPFGIFSLTPILGPLIAPIASGFLASAYDASPNDGFRPVFWLLLTFSGLLFITFTIFLPETYHPYLLSLKAKKLREETGDDRYWSRLDREDHSFKAMSQKVLMRPILMLFTEPIVFLLSLYLALVYGIIYLFFELYPAIFMTIHGFNPGVGSLPLLAVALGSAIAYLIFPIYERKYNKAYVANGNISVPEERLPPLFISGPLLVISLFWLGWTSDKHWALPTFSGLLSGYAIFFTFQCVLTYLGDVYALYAASAFAAAQMFRSLFGFAFPLFTASMIAALGVPWTASLLGFIALLLSPVPWLFYNYGKRIRGVSRYSFS